MPVTEQAKRALRKDRRRTRINAKWRKAYKEAVKNMRQNPSKENLEKAQSVLDRSARRNVIHPNKAARLKSRLATLLTKE